MSGIHACCGRLKRRDSKGWVHHPETDQAMDAPTLGSKVLWVAEAWASRREHRGAILKLFKAVVRPMMSLVLLDRCADRHFPCERR